MKILYLSSYFGSRVSSSYLGDNRKQKFAEEGFEMYTYAPVPSRGLSKDERKYFLNNKTLYFHNGKEKVHLFWLFKEGKNTILRAARYFLQTVMHFFYGVWGKDAKKCDVMIISSTPPIQGAMAGLVKKFNKKPIVFSLQDIFPDSLVNNGLAQKDGFLWKIGRKIENFTYKNADKIVVISEDFKKNIMAKGVPEDKITVIYNWVDQDAVVDIPRNKNKLFDKYNLDRDNFYITYNGNIGLSQNIDLLLEVAGELKSLYQDIHFVLVGEGAYLDKTKQIIKEQNLSNVHLLPFQPYEDISHVFSLGDVSLVISKPGTGQASVPSKTWSIMSASRPVLANFDENELKDIIEKNQTGIFTKAGDKDAFKHSILTLYNNRELCETYGKNGRQFVLDNLTKEIGTQKWVDVLNSVEFS